MGPPDVAVGIVDVHDAPVQGTVSDQAAGNLNLGKLWHSPVLPARGPAPTARQVMTALSARTQQSARIGIYQKGEPRKCQPRAYVRDGGNRESFRGSGAQQSRRGQDH